MSSPSSEHYSQSGNTIGCFNCLIYLNRYEIQSGVAGPEGIRLESNLKDSCQTIDVVKHFYKTELVTSRHFTRTQEELKMALQYFHLHLFFRRQDSWLGLPRLTTAWASSDGNLTSNFQGKRSLLRIC